MTSSSRRTDSSRRLERRPDWRRRARRPRGGVSRSSRDSSKPSRVAATASSRSRAGRAASASVTSRHSPGAEPRPTRPRSWCSWETPNRSASITTMTVALGTSTPTSIDRGGDQHVDVAGGEPAHHVVLGVGGQPAVQHLDARARRAAPRRASERRRARRPPAAPALVASSAGAGSSPEAASSLGLAADARADDVRLVARRRPPRGPAARPGRGSAASRPTARRGW